MYTNKPIPNLDKMVRFYIVRSYPDLPCGPGERKEARLIGKTVNRGIIVDNNFCIRLVSGKRKEARDSNWGYDCNSVLYNILCELIILLGDIKNTLLCY